MLKRFVLGAATGGALIYLFDPEHGPERRQKLMELWQENREPVLRATQSVTQTVQETAPKVKEQVTRRTDGSSGGTQTL